MYTEPIKTFEVKPYHLKLLQRCWTSWDHCEFGAPEIDPKRPFGNSGASSILAVVAKETGALDQIGNLVDLDEYTIYDVLKLEKIQELNNIYKELEICLQILLNDLAIVPGRYQLIGYGKNWKYIGD